MRHFITILILLSAFSFPLSAQVTTDTKDVQVARQKLQVGTDNTKWVSSIVEAISAASTHRQSPTARAVYRYVQSIDSVRLAYVDSLFATAGGQVDTFYRSNDTIFLKLVDDAVKYVVLPVSVTNLSFTGATSPVTLNSSTGTDVQFRDSTGIAIRGIPGKMTILNTGDTNASDDITGTLASGHVPYATGPQTVAGSNNLFWDAVNARLGLGTNTPSARLMILGQGGTSATYALIVTNSVGNTSTATIAARNDGNVGFGTNAPLSRIDVSGTLTISSNGNINLVNTGTLQQIGATDFNGLASFRANRSSRIYAPDVFSMLYESQNGHAFETGSGNYALTVGNTVGGGFGSVRVSEGVGTFFGSTKKSFYVRGSAVFADSVLTSFQIDQNLSTYATLAATRGNIYVNNKAVIGALVEPVASATLELRGTSSGLLINRLTTTQQNSMTPVAGVQVHNTTLTTNATYDGTRWTYSEKLLAPVTATLDFPNTNAGECSELTVTVNGAVDGDHADVAAPNASWPDRGGFFARVSAANTVTVRYCNNDLTNAKDPASGTFKVKVSKF